MVAVASAVATIAALATAIAPAAADPIGHPTATAATAGARGATPISAAVKAQARRLASTRSTRASTTSRPTGIAIPHVDSDVTANAGESSVHVTVHGSSAALSAAVTAVGGQVVATVAGVVSAIVPTSELARLAATPGITHIARAVPAFTTGVNSEGVAASGATAWHNAGLTGSVGGNGVRVAIVDGGFGNLSAETANGDLPSGLTVTTNYCGTDPNTGVDSTEHGTAVTEIVHQMAPSARLYLYCVSDSVGFQAAESQIENAGIKIVNSSLAFPGDSRGDGTGPDGSTAQTVARARKAGILWVQSAGNNGVDHWGGTLARDPVAPALTLLNPAEPHTSLDDDTANTDIVDVFAGNSGLAVLQWDRWPTSTLLLRLTVQAFDPHTGDLIGNPIVATQSPGSRPVLSINLDNTAGTDELSYLVSIGLPGGTIPAVRFDLSYWGAVDPSDYASSYPTSTGAMSSITEPASSPYVLAVGAADAGTGPDTCFGDTTSAEPLESYSSRGPTIDGRIKPDLVGYDGTTSNLSEDNPFCGTSAAAPHVTGAAALVSAANPALDASQIQALLEDRAGTAAPSNTAGHGLLQLGATTGIAARAGASYSALASPVRVLDTRTTNGGHHAKLGAGQTVTVTVNAPAGATAVAINLTGTGITGGTYLKAYPGTTVSPTSNLNLSATDPTAAVFAVVTLASNRTITVRNYAATVDVIVDVLGFFSPTGSDKYTASTPTRILSTVTGAGIRAGKIANQVVSVQAPAGADAIVINVTAANATAGGYFSLAPTGTTLASTLNFTGTPRANMAIVKVGPDGTFKLRVLGGPVDAIIDLLGTLSPSGTSTYVALPAPTRIVDTRTGNGGRLGAIGGSVTQLYTGSGVGDIPYTATALMTGVTAVANGATTYVIVYPASGNRPVVSTVNVTAGRIVANAAAINLAGNAFDVYNNAASMSVIVDVFGYFAT